MILIGQIGIGFDHAQTHIGHARHFIRTPTTAQQHLNSFIITQIMADTVRGVTAALSHFQFVEALLIQGHDLSFVGGFEALVVEVTFG